MLPLYEKNTNVSYNKINVMRLPSLTHRFLLVVVVGEGQVWVVVLKRDTLALTKILIDS